jgi:membrane-associated phospholipid phosphatase
MVAAGALYAAMWLGYRHGWAWLDAVDASCLRALHDVGARHPAWVRFWEVFCDVVSPGTFRLLAVAAAVLAWLRRQWRVALLVLVSVELSELVSVTAKRLANRPRPVTAFVHESSSAFPSGHALGSIVGVLALLTVLPLFSQRLHAVAAAVVGALIVLAVGFGRVALNVHHPSDVLAGWALGYLFFTLCRFMCGGTGRRLRRPPVANPGRESAAMPPACPPPV